MNWLEHTSILWALFLDWATVTVFRCLWVVLTKAAYFLILATRFLYSLDSLAYNTSHESRANEHELTAHHECDALLCYFDSCCHLHESSLRV